MNNKPFLSLIAVAGLIITALLFLFSAAIPQDPGIHLLADQREFFRIPHFLNVVTNLPFLVIGLIGIRLIVNGRFPGGLPKLRMAYLLFFAGIFLTGLGSTYYHLHLNNDALVWDRLPMTMAFMAFFSLIIGENIDIEAAQRILYPLIIAGIASVAYWYWGEKHHHGDLRFYALVQFLPILLIPLILVTGKVQQVNNHYRWALLGAYVAAKLAEYGDLAIYQHSGLISGHSLKHLLAASGVALFYFGLKKPTHPPSERFVRH